MSKCRSRDRSLTEIAAAVAYVVAIGSSSTTIELLIFFKSTSRDDSRVVGR